MSTPTPTPECTRDLITPKGIIININTPSPYTNCDVYTGLTPTTVTGTTFCTNMTSGSTCNLTGIDAELLEIYVKIDCEGCCEKIFKVNLDNCCEAPPPPTPTPTPTPTPCTCECMFIDSTLSFSATGNTGNPNNTAFYEYYNCDNELTTIVDNNVAGFSVCSYNCEIVKAYFWRDDTYYESTTFPWSPFGTTSLNYACNGTPCCEQSDCGGPVPTLTPTPTPTPTEPTPTPTEPTPTPTEPTPTPTEPTPTPTPEPTPTPTEPTPTPTEPTPTPTEPTPTPTEPTPTPTEPTPTPTEPTPTPTEPTPTPTEPPTDCVCFTYNNNTPSLCNILYVDCLGTEINLPVNPSIGGNFCGREIIFDECGITTNTEQICIGEPAECPPDEPIP